MPARWKLCQCRALGCIEQECIDPDTAKRVPGRMLTREVYQSHEDAEREWVSNRRERDFVNAVTSATLMNVDPPDASVTAHQGMHSYARSHRAANAGTFDGGSLQL